MTSLRHFAADASIFGNGMAIETGLEAALLKLKKKRIEEIELR